MNRIKSVSDRGRLIRELDKLFSQLIAKERGPNCEIHNKPCSQTGNMHILSKQAHPRLRYCRENIIRAGWFCSHFWTHNNPDDPRAKQAKERIIELRGPSYYGDLLDIERYMSQHSKIYLLARKNELKAQLKELTCLGHPKTPPA